jgi:hypothetical protein
MSSALAGVEAPRRVKRRLGLPFDGFTSSVPAHECPIGKAHGVQPTSTQRSLNMLYDPIEGKFFRRAGYASVGGTTGVLEAGPATMRARQLLSIDSPSIRDLGDGYPTHAVLFTREHATAANNNSALYVRSTIGSINYTFGMEYSSSHYPGTNAATANIKCVPYYRTRDGVWGRLNSATKRQYALAGSRQMIEAGRHLYFPNLDSIPMRWNKRYNESTSAGTENLRLFPTGCIPPLGFPTVTTGTLNADGPWQNGDKFYYSVVFQHADGGFSLPMIPRSINDQLTAGFLLKTIAADCNYVTVGEIPIGPDDVVARWLLRTPKFNNSGATPIGTEPDPLDLRVWEYIPNNTQQTLKSTAGNDLALAVRDDVVNFARQWPSPARHISHFDGRFIMGYTNPPPAAIVICPNVQVTDDSASILTNVYEFAVRPAADPTKLVLYKDNATDATSKITCDSTVTVQQVVDSINALTGGGAGGRWFAALAPGADGTATADNVATTVGVDVGDTTYAATERVRAFATSYPAVAYWSTTYLTDPARKGPFKNRWRFSEGGPHLAGSNFADMWPAGNIRTGLESWGIYMGAAPLLDGCLIFFSKAIILFRNVKSGRSGLDEDYHPDDLFTTLGCISSGSICFGDGWAGCMTDKGFFVFDGTRQGLANISGDLWNPATQTGEWAYEIAQSIAGAAKDDDSSRFEAKVMDGSIYLNYRSDASAGNGIPNRQVRYNFSGSISGSGLAQALRPDGTPWGWSAPENLALTVMGEVRKSTGSARYGVSDANLGGGSNVGLINQIDTGTTDDSVAISAELWLALDFAESMRNKQAQELTVFYKVNGSGCKVHVRLDNGTTAADATGSGLALPTTGASGTFKKLVIPLPQTARGQCMAAQVRFTDDGSGGALEVWGAELDSLITGSYV